MRDCCGRMATGLGGAHFQLQHAQDHSSRRFRWPTAARRPDGSMAIPGVAVAPGAPVRLDFLSPGGATTGKLLPTGNPVDALMVPDVGLIAASMIDAGNACVFVLARDLGLTGRELPGGTRSGRRAVGQAATYSPHRRGRDGDLEGRRGGAHDPRCADHWLRRGADGRAHPVGGADRCGSGRPNGTLPVERTNRIGRCR